MKKLNIILLLGMITSFVFVACNNDKGGATGGRGWSSQDKNAWMNDCKNAMGGDGNASKLCNCMLTKMEKDYANYNDANTRGGEQLGAKLRQQCDNEMGNRNNNNGDDNNFNNENNNNNNNNQNGNDNDDDDNGDDDNDDN